MVITFLRMKNVLENYGSMVSRKSLCLSQVTHQTGAYPGICSIKRLALLLIPPGWDANLSQGSSPNAVPSPVPIIHLGVDRNWLIEQAKLKLCGILYNQVLKKIFVRQNSVEYATTMLASLFNLGHK